MLDKKLNIAVVFEGHLHSGGGFSHQITTLIDLKNSSRYNFRFYFFSDDNFNFAESTGADAYLIKPSKKEIFFDKLLFFLFEKFGLPEFFYFFSARLNQKSFLKMLNQNNTDIVYFMSPSYRAMSLESINYIFTVWDLCHRDWPEFPEVNHWREFEKRELVLQNSLGKALAVITDSETGKKKLARRYALDEERIFSASFLPSIRPDIDYIDIRRKYDLKNDFIFYPAQFWQHKNHIYILKALKILNDEGIKIDAVFTGVDQGNMANVKRFVERKKLTCVVKFLGFIPIEELYSFYNQSQALVMPTFFGPTNIPPLEAFKAGVPVIYSDFPEMREFLKEAALYCNLDNPESLVECIKKVLFDKTCRDELKRKGTARLSELQKHSTTNVLNTILSQFEKCSS